MTVKELLDALKCFPEDIDVTVFSNEFAPNFDVFRVAYEIEPEKGYPGEVVLYVK